MRISAGKWKGRTLPVPPGARPTSARAREALFDLLGERVTGARVLDLFAGSGAVGFEAVSRGAARSVLVEPDGDALQRTRAAWNAAEEVAVIAGDAGRAVAALARSGERFDIVFADPPYTAGEPLWEALSGVAAVLAGQGILVLQTDAKTEPPDLPGLKPFSHRAYARNVFHFLRIL